MQFPWNLQLLTRHCLFRNLPCPTTDLSTVEADRISEMLNTSSVTRAKVLDILNAFWQDNTCYWSSSQNFVVFMVRYFFLLNHFLVVEDYELLTLEYVRILSWFISFLSILIVSLIMFYVRLLRELMILLSNHYVTKHLTCHNKFR